MRYPEGGTATGRSTASPASLARAATVVLFAVLACVASFAATYARWSTVAFRTDADLAALTRGFFPFEQGAGLR